MGNKRVNKSVIYLAFLIEYVFKKNGESLLKKEKAFKKGFPLYKQCYSALEYILTDIG